MDDQVTYTMGSKERISIETSNSAPLKPNKLMVKLKISKNSFQNSYGGSNQHVCPVCSKGFTSGKALGGHIRIHMSKSGSRHKKISKHQPKSNAKSKKNNSNMASIDDQNQENNEKVSCCICNKDFKSMKSLFGHMRNHPERNWRGIRPPPSDKNSCCSSVSENEEAFSAVEVVDQVKGSSSVSDLVKSLPNSWSNTNKRLDKSSSSLDHDEEDDEVPVAAYCLMKLSRGHSFDWNHYKTKTKNPSSLDKASELKGKAKVKTECEFLSKELNENLKKLV